MSKPRCPCGHRKYKNIGPGRYQCLKCKGHFDDDPEEGGTHYADPTKRMREAEKPPQREGLKGGLGR